MRLATAMGARATEQALRSITSLAATVAGIVLVALMMLTAADVFLRYVFVRPIVGSAEASESMMVVTGFLALALCALEGRHIKVDLLVSRFPPRAQLAVNAFNYLIVAGLSVLAAFETYNQAFIVRRLGVASNLLHIPQYPFYLVISVSYLLLLLTVGTLFLQSISRLVRR